MALLDLSNSPKRSTMPATTFKREREEETAPIPANTNLKAKRRFAPSSIAPSSSSPAPNSSSPFVGGATRFHQFDAYSAPSSPISTASFTLPTSPIQQTKQVQLPAEEAEPDYREVLDSDPIPLVIPLQLGTVIQFGRKAKRPTKPGKEITLAIRLPASAKNASRLHCTARIVVDARAEEDRVFKLEVQVVGMNGMKIDGKYLEKGSILLKEVKEGQQFLLAFWGWTAALRIARLGQRQQEAMAAPLSNSDVSEVQLDIATPLSIPIAVARLSTPAPSIRPHVEPSPASSSVYGSLFEGEDHDADEEEEEEEKDVVSTLPGSSSSAIASQPVVATRDISPAASDLSIISSPSSLNTPTQSNDQPSPETLRARSLASSLNLDLPSSIATAIVFHPRATVGVDEVIRALLHEVGGMWDILSGGKGEGDSTQREELAVEAWWEVVEDVLRKEPFFGCIENIGLRDAAGNALAPAFYYLPESDPSPGRVEALEPFVKRVRGARTAGGGKRYFWRKPSLKKNR